MLGIKCLAWDPGSGYAVSPVSPAVWTGRVVRATCYKNQWTRGREAAPVERFETHPAPCWGCYCGIHALADTLFLADYLANSPLSDLLGSRLFSALLRASGVIIEHDIGWKAEEAEILAVGPAPTMFAYPLWAAREAGAALGVPFFDNTAAMWSYAIEATRLAPEAQEEFR